MEECLSGRLTNHTGRKHKSWAFQHNWKKWSLIALDRGVLLDMTHNVWVIQAHILNINCVRNKCLKPRNFFLKKKTKKNRKLRLSGKLSHSTAATWWPTITTYYLFGLWLYLSKLTYFKLEEWLHLYKKQNKTKKTPNF